MTNDRQISLNAAINILDERILANRSNVALVSEFSRSINYLKLLPSVQPERPKGHWIDTGSGQECSECGEIQYGYDNFRYYCAKCGSDNRGK